MDLTFPTALYLLAVLPIFVLLFVWRSWVRQRQLAKIGDTDLVNKLIAQVSPLRRSAKSLLWLACLASLIFAIARPTWGETQTVIAYEGVQVVFVVDVSRSMDVQDVRPSRLLQARLDLSEMMTALEGNDLGMVLFAGTAFTYLPVTLDLDAALLFLDDLSTDAITLQGTDLDAAIREGLRAFSDNTQAQKAMVLLSDGEHHEADVTEAVEAAMRQNVTIHALGYGTTEGGRVPVYDLEGNLVEYKTNPGGTLVNSALDETLLVEVAAATDGIYQRATSGQAHQTPILEAIQAMQRGELGEQVITQPAEQYSIFAALALLFLSLEIILPESNRRK